MRSKRMLLFLVCGLLAMSMSADQLDDILQKHYKAMGGLDKLKAVQSVKVTGKMAMPAQGIEAPMTVYMKRPNMVRMEFTLQGMTGVQATDGTDAWQVMPFMGKNEPEPMPPDQAKDINDMADIDGPLVDWKAKGNKLELMGEADAEGTPCYKLKLTKKDGDVVYVYLDKEYYLEIRDESTRKVNGTEVETYTNFGDFKPEGGIMMPHVIDSGVKGTQMKQTITFEKVEPNAEIDDAMFKMPPPKPAAEKKEEPKKQ